MELSQTTQPRKLLILENGEPPKLTGTWTIGEVLAAADFLRRWIESQQIAVQSAMPAPPQPAAKGNEHETNQSNQ